MTRLLTLLAMALLVACSSQPVAPTQYLLRSDLSQASGPLVPSDEFRFRSLVVADYIDQPGVVIETGAGEVRAARGHQWAEPLRRSLKTFLGTEVSARIGQDVLFNTGSDAATAIDVTIDQLHGTESGDAILVAYWRLVSGAGPDRAFQFTRDRPLERDGYRALVAAERELLRELASAIAQSLTAPE